MDDFADITTDFSFPDPPRISDLDMPWPTAEVIRAWVRAANRWPPDMPIPDSMVATFRQQIVRKAYAIWHARRKERRIIRVRKSVPRRHRRQISLLVELMSEPWFQVGVSVLVAATAVPIYFLWVTLEESRYPLPPFRESPSRMGSALLEHLHRKIGIIAKPPRISPHAWEISPLHISAINAMSSAAARELYFRLVPAAQSSRHAQIDRIFSELDSVGQRSISEFGEWLCEPEIDREPRGMVAILPVEIAEEKVLKKKADAEVAKVSDELEKRPKR